MCDKSGPALLQVMACRLLGAKPLPKPMQTYCQVDAKERTSIKSESKYKTFCHGNAFEIVVCEIVQGDMS